MESSRVLKDWDRGDALEAARLQAIQELAESAQLTANSSNVRLYRSPTGAGTTIAVEDGSPQLKPQRSFPAIITCYGPRGPGQDPLFTDNRYWFIRAKLTDRPTGSTSEGEGAGSSTPDQTEAAIDASKVRVEFEKLATDDPNYLHRACTNLFEDNCGTHYVRPDTPVIVFWDYDQATPPQKRYWILVADEGTCRSQPCDASSSSSQSSTSAGTSLSSGSGSASRSGSGPGSSTGSGSGSTGSGGGSTGSGGSIGSGGSGSMPGGSMGSGSDKSTAIVPASWSPTGYTALFIHEMPEVRFDDVIVKTLPQANTVIAIDPKFVEVCEPDTIQVCGCAADLPIVVGARVRHNRIAIQFPRTRAKKRRDVQLVIRLTGIRRGFAGMRFPDRTQRQFEQNERFINSAYEGSEPGA